MMPSYTIRIVPRLNSNRSDCEQPVPCLNHPSAVTANRCTGCAESFCSKCLVTIAGLPYCATCKAMAVTKAPVVEASIPCPEAGEALKYAILSIFCFGFIIGPIAFFKALAAKKLIAADPTLLGGGKATAALVISAIVFVLNILGLIARASSH